MSAWLRHFKRTAPADENHPYGHGRVETLAAFLVGVILVAGGVGNSCDSLQAVGETHPAPSRAAVAVLTVAILLNCGLIIEPHGSKAVSKTACQA